MRIVCTKRAETVLAVALVAGFWTVGAQANPLISGNSAGTVGVVTYDFATGAVVNSFVPTGAFGNNNGRGLVVVGNEVFYTVLTGTGFGPTDFIRVAPFNGGAGGADTRTLPNPRPGFGVQDLAFSGGILFALTGYQIGPLQVFGLNPTTGAVVAGPVTIGSPATGDSDGFTVLPNGNFLVNNGDANCTYNQYNPATGAVIPATTIVVPGTSTACTGVDTDGVSLFFHTLFPGSLTRTDFSGVLITRQPVTTIGFIEDITLIHDPAASAASVPTLSTWGLIGLATLLVGLGVQKVCRRRVLAA